MSSSPPHHKRTRIACKPCRQNKIRCGMRSPPCARCARLEIECIVEPHFRRSNQRDRVRQSENHAQETHQAPMSPSDNTARNVPDEAVPSAGSDKSVMPDLTAPAGGRDAGERQHRGHLDDELPPETRTVYTIGSVTLDAVQADQLLRIFVRKYHPMLPFLDDTRNAANYYAASRLLFWSIMAVAARHFDTDTTLLPRLTVVLSELLHRTVLSQSVSVAQVQALIILVCWPLPNYRLRTDNSLLYANIALTGAMQLGLHMPGYEHEYTASHDRMPPSPEKALERIRTWVAAVILSQSLSTDLGLAPIAPMMIDGLTSRPWLEIPQTLKQYLVIQEYSYRATQTLLQASQSPSDPLAFYSTLASLERSFDTLQEDLGTELSFVNTIRLSAARLHLQSMYFLPHTSRQRQQRRDGLLRAYTTAASLITTAISHKDSLEDLLYAPAEVLRMIFAAALVVFRVSNSSYADMLGPRSGTSSGRALSSMACFAIHRCSVQRGENKDLAARMVDMLGIIWRYAEADARLLRQEPVVQVSSRMGAGVVFDCLDIWRRYKTGREPQYPPTPQQSCTTSQESRVDHVLGSSAALEGASLDGALPEGLDMVAASTFDEDLAWNFSASLDPSPENWGVYGLV